MGAFGPEGGAASGGGAGVAGGSSLGMSAAVAPAGSFTGAVATLRDVPLRGQPFTARWGLASAQLRGKVYVFGGYLWYHGIEGFFHDLFEMDISSGVVRRLSVNADGSPVPQPRFGHTLVADPSTNQLLLFGGRNGSESFGDLWAFDVARNQWSLLAPLPGGADGAAGAGRAGKRKSGKSAGDKGDPDGVVPASPSASSPGPQGRSWHTAVCYRGCLYVYGGWDHQSKVFNDLWSFEITAGGSAAFTWQRIDPPDAISSPPHGRSCHAAAVYNDCMYVFGGLRDGDAAVADMWRFSFEQRVWAPVDAQGAKPQGRTSAAHAVVDQSWIIHGGLTDYPRPGMTAINEVIEFDFATATWTQRVLACADGANAIAARYGHSAIALSRSAVLLIGGAEKYACACATPACRIDLLPSQSQITEAVADIIATGRIAHLNRDRLAELIEVVQNYETQLRQSKAETAALSDRVQSLQSQMASLHQQHSALQGAFTAMQQTLAAVEQFIPMMRNVGAAIANFGSVAAGAAAWTTPGSSQSLAGVRPSLAHGVSGTLGSSAGLADSPAGNKQRDQSF